MTLPRSEARPPTLLAALLHSPHLRLPACSSHFSPSRFLPLPIIPCLFPQLSFSAPAHPPPRSLSAPGLPRHDRLPTSAELFPSSPSRPPVLFITSSALFKHVASTSRRPSIAVPAVTQPAAAAPATSETVKVVPAAAQPTLAVPAAAQPAVAVFPTATQPAVAVLCIRPAAAQPAVAVPAAA